MVKTHKVISERDENACKAMLIQPQHIDWEKVAALEYARQAKRPTFAQTLDAIEDRFKAELKKCRREKKEMKKMK